MASIGGAWQRVAGLLGLIFLSFVDGSSGGIGFVKFFLDLRRLE